MSRPVHISVFNHGVGARSLVDMRVFLTDGLSALGYDVTFGERIESGRLNLLFEYFSSDFGRRLLDSGATFGIIATEVPMRNEQGVFLFNGGRTDLDWGMRASQFQIVAEKAEFIWAMDPREETLAMYRQFAPTSYLGVGYSSSLHQAMRSIDIEPDLDFAFTGVVTEYRVQILDRLRKKAAVGYEPGLLTFERRNLMLRRAKCNLALKLEQGWPLPSFTRIMSLLHAERMALSDVTDWCSAPADLVPQIEPETLAADPYGVLAAPSPMTPLETILYLAETRPAAKVLAEAWEGLTR